MRDLRTLPLLLILLTAPALAQAQVPSTASGAVAGVPDGFEVRWHIVRPGETLRGITARYLGASDRWQENHRLNPDIADPDRLLPGQRIRVLLPRRGAPPAAQVRKVSRRVESKPSPVPWSEAWIDDLLLERDGLRTYTKSSAEMEFTDGTRLQVTEDSLVFLSRTGSKLRGVDRKAVEIVQGQADFESRPAAGRATPEVEIVLGATRATAKPGPAGTSQSRARRIGGSAGGGAKVMVYGGEGEVEAGGARVALAEGTGTSVAPTGPPAPPEKLLPAPRLHTPAGGAEVACSNPGLSWDPVPEAASYTVEVCRDAACGALVERREEHPDSGWRPASLPEGELYWRVTARSRSGLDGYPSTATRLAVTSALPDLDPPTGTLEVTGRQMMVGERLIVAPDAAVRVAVEDAGSGPGPWEPLVDGAASSPESRWSAGPRQVGAAVSDRCGNRISLAPVALVVDAAAPTLRWKVGAPREFDARGEPQGWEQFRQRRRDRGLIRSVREVPADGSSPASPPASPLAWSAGGLGWLPLQEGVESAIRLTSERPQLFLRGNGLTLTADGQAVPLADGQVLWIQAEDDAAGVESLTVQVRPGGGALEIEVTDAVGNSRRVEWPLAGPHPPAPSPASPPPAPGEGETNKRDL